MENWDALNVVITRRAASHLVTIPPQKFSTGNNARTVNHGFERLRETSLVLLVAHVRWQIGGNRLLGDHANTQTFSSHATAT